ncbi:hypothetical protein EON66_05830, partial [archaeon]
MHLADAVFVSLYLADMSHFGAVNEAYCQYFGAQPPSRACVQCTPTPLSTPLSAGSDCERPVVWVSAVIAPHSYEAMQRGVHGVRQSLHVQSISHWAPLCIGPYCQANVVRDALVLIAGQIGLRPADMVLWPDAARQTAQSFRNTARIAACLGSNMTQALSLTIYMPAVG